MNRRSLIKCILGVAAAPKILAELDFNPPMVAATMKGETTFDGIFPYILKQQNVVEYQSGDWCMTDLNEIIDNYYNNHRP